jgi:hypothetical protein
MKITKGPPFLFNFSILNLADEVVQYLILVPWMLSYMVDNIKITGRGHPFFLIFPILSLVDKVVLYLLLAPWMLSYRMDIMKITGKGHLSF